MANITLKDVFEVTSRIEDKLDKIEVRVGTIELWKADIMGKLTLVGAFLIVSINIGWDFVRSKFLKNL